MSDLPLNEQNDLRSKSLSTRSGRFCELKGEDENQRFSSVQVAMFFGAQQKITDVDLVIL